MVTGQETGGRARGGMSLRGVWLAPILAACALAALTVGGLAAATLGGCGNDAADQGTATASPSETASALSTPEPLGEHRATAREKSMLAAAAEYVKDPKYMPWRTDPDDFRKYVGQPGEIVAYVVTMVSEGFDMSAVVDTASGKVRPVATIKASSDDPYFGVPWHSDTTGWLVPKSKGEIWATEAAKWWFYDQVYEKLGWPAGAGGVVQGYIVGWPDVGVLQLYVGGRVFELQEDDGKPEAWGLGSYLPW